jgi:hypothetical protein
MSGKTGLATIVGIDASSARNTTVSAQGWELSMTMGEANGGTGRTAI